MEEKINEDVQDEPVQDEPVAKAPAPAPKRKRKSPVDSKPAGMTEPIKPAVITKFNKEVSRPRFGKGHVVVV
jgi:hypothetical protein